MLFTGGHLRVLGGFDPAGFADELAGPGFDAGEVLSWAGRGRRVS